LIPISLRMKPRMIYCLDHRDAMFWSRLLAMLFRCPHVMSQHALNIAGAGAPDRRIYKFIIKATAPLSSKIIACGNTVRDSLIRWGIPSAKIEVIQNGVAIHSGRPRSDSNSWRAGLKIPAETKLVGIVAALEPVKTHWVFLEAAQKVLKRFPQTRFVVVGDGFLRSRLEKKAHALGIADRVLFLGSVTPATEVIQALDIGVLSSASEAFPLVLLEYMEAGLPVVSTDSGGPAEIIQNGQSGFIVPVNHPDSMAEKVSYLLKFQEQARQMGRQGRQRVRECFSLEKMIARHISLFDRLTA
jgi:glycosyltransferase involved in cell wall biosynthesis